MRYALSAVAFLAKACRFDGDSVSGLRRGYRYGRAVAHRDAQGIGLAERLADEYICRQCRTVFIGRSRQGVSAAYYQHANPFCEFDLRSLGLVSHVTVDGRTSDGPAGVRYLVGLLRGSLSPGETR